jgi:hypothetical protein
MLAPDSKGETMRQHALKVLAASLIVTVLAWPVHRVEASGKSGRYNVTLVGCTLPDGDGNAFFQKDAAREIRVSDEGVATVQCRGSVPTVPGFVLPKQAIKFDYATTNAACGTPYGATATWQAKVLPTGAVTLTCTFQLVM